MIGVVLHATPLGRSIFAIGAGHEAAFFAGIRVKRIKFWLFVLSGVLSGFAGILWTLRFASARYDSGTGQELLVVTIVLLGGDLDLRRARDDRRRRARRRRSSAACRRR